MRNFIIFICLLIFSPAHAQVLEGIVVDNETKSTIPGITVINMHTHVVVFSDSGGYYSIQAEAGDTILFTHTSYIPVHEVMSFSFGKKYKPILMKAMVYSLKTATISGLTKYQRDSLANREMFTHAMNEPITHFSPIFSPVSFVADKILGISKRAKRFKADYYNDEQNAFIDSRYTRELVSSLTGLKDDSTAFFMNAYPMPYDFARFANDLEVKMWVRNNYKQYLNKTKGSAVLDREK